MELSVVILNYKVKWFLEQCILSVQKAIAGMDAEIIVIDNDSQDGSCEMVRQQFPGITLIENKENVGFSKANNQAVAIAKGKYICILNPDTAVEEDTFIAALDFYKSKENIGALGVYLMDGTGNFLPESKRNFPSTKASLLKLIGNDSKYYASHVSKEGDGQVDVLVGAFMLMKKSIYDEAGGFDEDYFMYGEDIDLSFKITKKGYSNYYLGSTKTLHYKGESTRKDEVYFNRFYGAMEIFYKKHLRQNWFEEKTVSFGVFMAKKANKWFKSSGKSKKSSVERYVFISDDRIFLLKLNEKFKKEFELISKEELKSENIEKAYMVFDAGVVSYQEIFSLMEELKNKGNQFRIRPPQRDFILGSDRSDEKGEVMVFS